MNKVIKYIQESINEIKKVSWLSPREIKRITLEVILFSLLLAIIYGVLDTVLSRLILILK